MQRLIRFDRIREIVEEINKNLIDLKNDKSNLLLKIQSINEWYEGKDATALIEKYTDKVNDLDEYIKVMEEYRDYFALISDSYKESYHKLSREISPVPEVEEINDTLSEEVLGDNVINNIDDNNINENSDIDEVKNE